MGELDFYKNRLKRLHKHLERTQDNIVYYEKKLEKLTISMKKSQEKYKEKKRSEVNGI